MRGIHRSRWIPRTKASDAELWCFLWSADWVNNREAGDWRRHRGHNDVNVMCHINCIKLATDDAVNPDLRYWPVLPLNCWDDDEISHTQLLNVNFTVHWFHETAQKISPFEINQILDKFLSATDLDIHDYIEIKHIQSTCDYSRGYLHSISRKCIWKCRRPNDSHLV